MNDTKKETLTKGIWSVLAVQKAKYYEIVAYRSYNIYKKYDSF